MNLENTKLDLSGYSEEGRKEVFRAYESMCINQIVDYRTKLALNGSNAYFLLKDCSYNDATEVKPIKKEEWVSINSLDDLKVGDVVKHLSTGIARDVKYVGAKAYCEKMLTHSVITADRLSSYQKLTTTYTFEPVQDDTLAIEAYETFRDSIPKDYYCQEWDGLAPQHQNAWRAVANLKRQQK